MSTYKGFSTVNDLSQKSFRLVDFELVKQDILNSLYTRRGSRLMNPNEGCIVWDLLYEPLTNAAKEEINENLTEIVNRDPRVRLQEINLIPQQDQNTITAELRLFYLPTSQIETLIVRFNSEITQDSSLM